jgi:predicted transposase/invertase (TIGR01784 family)
LITLTLGRTADRWTVIFERREDLEVLLSRGKPGLHYLGLLIQYVMLVNSEATPESLSEALKPMGTEAQDLPKTYGQRLLEQGRDEGRDEGELRAKHALARKLLAKGTPPSEVAELTELPLEEVQKLTHWSIA